MIAPPSGPRAAQQVPYDGAVKGAIVLSRARAAMASASNAALDSQERWYHVDKVLDRPGPSTDPAFVPGQPVRQLALKTRWSLLIRYRQVKSFLRERCKVLVIGAGGLGCTSPSFSGGGPKPTLESRRDPPEPRLARVRRHSCHRHGHHRRQQPQPPVPLPVRLLDTSSPCKAS